MDWSDNRPLAELTFGLEAPEAERAAVAARVRQTLADCGVKVADDIAAVGCTGLAKHGVSVDISRDLRMGLAGSGCGLVCFVSPTRWCSVHETPGGLQEGQVALHPEFAVSISRELTPDERVKIDLVERARRIQGKNGERISQAAEMLSGRALPEDLGDGDDEEASPAADDEILATTEEDAPPVESWMCPDHSTTAWGCRYCLAQAIVAGPLAPEYLIDSHNGDQDENSVEAVEPGEVDDVVNRLAKDKAVVLSTLYVRAARWVRKLARE